MMRVTLLFVLALNQLQVAQADDQPGKKLEWLRTRRLIKSFHATGVQHYECNGKEWVFRGPSAVLQDDAKKPVAVHYSCESCPPPATGDPDLIPAWNFFDQSVQHLSAKVDKVNSPVAGAVPWLALKLEGNGKGAVGKADHVLRVGTSGGNAPAKTQCASAADAGKWASSPYTADYEFRDSGHEAPREPGERPRGINPTTGGSQEAH